MSDARSASQSLSGKKVPPPIPPEYLAKAKRREETQKSLQLAATMTASGGGSFRGSVASGTTASSELRDSFMSYASGGAGGGRSASLLSFSETSAPSPRNLDGLGPFATVWVTAGVKGYNQIIVRFNAAQKDCKKASSYFSSRAAAAESFGKNLLSTSRDYVPMYEGLTAQRMWQTVKRKNAKTADMFIKTAKVLKEYSTHMTKLSNTIKYQLGELQKKKVSADSDRAKLLKALGKKEGKKGKKSKHTSTAASAAVARVKKLRSQLEDAEKSLEKHRGAKRGFTSRLMGRQNMEGRMKKIDRLQQELEIAEAEASQEAQHVKHFSMGYEREMISVMKQLEKLEVYRLHTIKSAMTVVAGMEVKLATAYSENATAISSAVASIDAMADIGAFQRSFFISGGNTDSFHRVTGNLPVISLEFHTPDGQDGRESARQIHVAQTNLRQSKFVSRVQEMVFHGDGNPSYKAVKAELCKEFGFYLFTRNKEVVENCLKRFYKMDDEGVLEEQGEDDSNGRGLDDDGGDDGADISVSKRMSNFNDAVERLVFGENLVGVRGKERMQVLAKRTSMPQYMDIKRELVGEYGDVMYRSNKHVVEGTLKQFFDEHAAAQTAAAEGAFATQDGKESADESSEGGGGTEAAAASREEERERRLAPMPRLGRPHLLSQCENGRDELDSRQRIRRCRGSFNVTRGCQDARGWQQMRRMDCTTRRRDWPPLLL